MRDQFLPGEPAPGLVPLEPGQALYISPDGMAVPITGPVVMEAGDGTETLIMLPFGEAGKE